MITLTKRVFGTGFMLATLLAAFASFAQDEAEDDFMPAVDTSAMPAVDTSADDEGPGPAADVTRSTTGSRVMDTMELGRTEVTGNQELPKVLYIVPWQKSNPGDLIGRPVNSLLDEVLAPVDREEFIRQVEYYDELYGSSDEAE
ncbi:MAG: hypothetical protein KJP08_06390 [Gammaproteobacteria bacterium]|nr:hypothetical protein [Gammaproteobacteria bacterium]NNF50416.1 hypothetical protein [Woeseiaceae bacterium]MBT8094419.1 hypothetical protein [Gammaproteobacteria bacterium]MBT8104758.1 hypothetical protein [Gammaproteobacteria bacterium]NNK24772.1 hypothetical protein [Woeseiaceae bacterium]